MKIAFITSHLTLLNGGGLVVKDYANGFCEKGYDVSVIAQKINHNIYKFNKKISLIEIGSTIPLNPLYWIKFHWIKKTHVNVLKDLQADFIISHDFPVNYFCSKIIQRKDLKHVYYCHEPYRFFYDKKFRSKIPLLKRIAIVFIKLFFKKYDKKGVIDADLILCNSNYTKNKIDKIYGREGHVIYPILNKKSDIILNGFDIRQLLNLKKEQPLIFSLGLTHPSKGVKELLYIFSIILKEIPEIILLIGGRIGKENQNTLKKLRKKLEIPQKNTIIYGIIEEELLKYFYSQSTLMFYTAIEESFGIIPVEAMNYGTPVIAFEGGPSETIQDGGTGHIIKNHDLGDFATKAIHLIKDKKLLNSFSIKAKAHVKTNFNFKKMLSEYENILNELITED